MGRKITDSNRLSLRNPDLKDEWHPEKNDGLTPDDVSYGSKKKVWWLCKNGHEWDAVISSRAINGNGCGYCAGNFVSDKNRLSLHYPGLVDEWHPSKNGDLTPDDVSHGSKKEVWWICIKDKNHVWPARIYSRARNGNGCRYCGRRGVSDINRLSIHYPHLKNEWHPKKNGELTPDDVPYGSNKRVWWLCKNGHEWEAQVYSRKSGKGCSYCAGQRVTDDNRLALNAPELVPEWHPTMNGNLTPDNVAIGTNERVWWICGKDNDHVWRAFIPSRAMYGSGCRFCARKEVTDVNRLSIHYPHLKNEWHPIKNGSIKPDDVSYGSGDKVWWICKNGHEWKARIYSRTLGRGCRFCAGKEVTDENRLSLRSPELVDEWHPERNGDLKPTDVSYGSDDKVWWLCEKGHEWETTISSRAINGSGCRNCKLAGRSRLEIYLACELATLFKDIDPTQTQKITTPEGKSLNADIAIPSENLVIEYDSLWWHNDRLDKDIEKTKRLKASGWDVLRIREDPLELIQDSDLPCQVTFGSHIKSLVDSVLVHLEEIFGIEISGLDEYLARESLVNEATADEIIDKGLAKQTKVESYQLRLPYL